jgi:Ca2+-binding EF-hand superfamily protein
MYTDLAVAYPLIWIFFIIFIFFTNLLLLNLITGVVVENVLEVARNDQEEQVAHRIQERDLALARLRHLFEAADIDSDGYLDVAEFEAILRDEDLMAKFCEAELTAVAAKDLFTILDIDGSGKISVDEFLSGAIRTAGNAQSKDLLSCQYELHRGVQVLLDEMYLMLGQFAEMVPEEFEEECLMELEEDTASTVKYRFCRETPKAASGDADKNVLDRAIGRTISISSAGSDSEGPDNASVVAKLLSCAQKLAGKEHTDAFQQVHVNALLVGAQRLAQALS